MKRLFLGLILLSIVKLGYPQSFKTFDGQNFNVGDTIQIGVSTYENEFKDIHSVTYQKNYVCQPLKKYVIIRIDPNDAKFKQFWKNNNAVRIDIAPKKGFFSLPSIINLDEAIRDGEVILKINSNRLTQKDDLLDEKLSFLFFCKQSKLPLKLFSKEYLYRFQNDVFTQTHEDEFEFQNSLSKAEKSLEVDLDKADTSKIYSIVSTIELGNYDFDKQAFAFDIHNSSFELLHNVPSPFASLPSISISFKNSSEQAYLQIPSAEANSFLKRRKNYEGRIDRTAYVVINFKLSQTPIKDINDYPTKSSYWLNAELKNIEFYDSKTFLYNWLGTVSY